MSVSKVRAALEARNEQIRRLGVLKAHIANELKTLAKLGKGTVRKLSEAEADALANELEEMPSEDEYELRGWLDDGIPKLVDVAASVDEAEDFVAENCE